MSERINVVEYVVDKSVYGSVIDDEKYEDDSLSSVIGWLAGLLESIPPEYRDSARVEVDSVGGYEGEHHSEFRVYYRRPETDVEMAKRLHAELREQSAREARERAIFENLRQKYERAP